MEIDDLVNKNAFVSVLFQSFILIRVLRNGFVTRAKRFRIVVIGKPYTKSTEAKKRKAPKVSEDLALQFRSASPLWQ